MTPTEELIVDCYHSPHLLRSLSDKSIPLPEGLERVLRNAAVINPNDPALNPQDRELREAVLIFVRHVVLAEGADHYRSLGLRFNAAPEQIDTHYRLLLALMADGGGTDLLQTSRLLGRISRAYAVLSQPDRRREYDKARFGMLVKDNKVSWRGSTVAARPTTPSVAVREQAPAPRVSALVAESGRAANGRSPQAAEFPALSNRTLATLSLFALLVIVAVSPMLTTQFSRFWFPQEFIASALNDQAAVRPAPVAQVTHSPPAVTFGHTGTSWSTPSGIVEARGTDLPPPKDTGWVTEPARSEVPPPRRATPVPVVAVAPPQKAAPVVAKPRERVTAPATQTPAAPTPRASAAPTSDTPLISNVDFIAQVLADGVTPAMASDTDADAVARSPAELPGELKVQQLNELMTRLSSAYRDGDTQLFMALFAEDAHTNDQMNKRGIKEDYRGLFESTEQREFSVDRVNWQVRGSAATGEGEFVVRVKPKWKSREDVVTGRLKLEVEQRASGMQITGLYHDYNN